MSKNNNAKAKEKNIVPENEREIKLQNQAFDKGYECGKTIGNMEAHFDMAIEDINKEFDPKNVRKQCVKTFINSFCCTFTGVVLTLASAMIIYNKIKK